METNSIPIQELLEKAPSHTIDELAEMYKTNCGTIYYILSRHKVNALPAYEPITKEVLEAVFEEPTTLEDAASQLHCSVATIATANKKFGIFGGKRKPTVKGKFVGERSFKVLGYLLTHPEESLASIGRRFNCTREYVRQVKECGVSEGILKSWASASDEFHNEAQQEGIEL